MDPNALIPILIRESALLLTQKQVADVPPDKSGTPSIRPISQKQACRGMESHRP